MKRIAIIAVMMAIVSGISLQAHADLQNLGTDSLGNRLIYDTDLNITWYDYTRPNNTWSNQMAWADTLAVTFGSNTYTDWRLPATVDGTWEWGWDGTTTAGMNIISSEMGHLYYVELHNKAYPESGWGLTNTGSFEHLIAAGYWSGTEYTADLNNAWYFYTGEGTQSTTYKGLTARAIAVRSGLAAAPEPVSSMLFILGGATLVFRRLRKRFRK